MSNEIDIKKVEKDLISLLNSKAKMKEKQKTLYISENLQNIFLKSNDLRISLNDVVISTCLLYTSPSPRD